MRILLIRNAYQKDTGGAEQYVYNLAKALRSCGHTPIVVTKHRQIISKCRDEKIKTIRGVWYEKQEWTRRYYFIKIYTTLWYLFTILRFRIDIVHPQSRDDFVFATNAAKIARRTAVWTDHADLKYILDRVNHPHPRMQSWILNAFKHVYSVTCVSNSEYDSILSVAKELEPKLTIIHNGVFVPDTVRPVSKDCFVVGTNARLVPEKGISELMTAFSNAKIKNSELWLLGGHSDNLARYTVLAEDLGIINKVKFLGYVSNPNDYVASMDIFVHASYHEAFSLAIIEAAMLGRPIIATKVGGTPEIIEDQLTGLLIEPKNSKAIEESLIKVYDNPDLANKIGVAAKKYSSKYFDFQKIVESKIIPLYERAKS